MTVAFAALMAFGQTSDKQVVVLDVDQVTNRHADQVGLWINTTLDQDDPEYRTVLRWLKLRSLRYGWQFGVVDERFNQPLIQTPRDPKLAQGLVNPKKRYRENFYASDIASLLDDLSDAPKTATGFAIASVDGIRYRGQADPKITALATDIRIHAYSRKAARWARWARDNKFQFFEIGNQTDLSGRDQQTEVLNSWTGSFYAKTTRQFLTDIKRFYPDAKCGINGGQRSKSENEKWFREFVEADPDLVDDLDFMIAYQDESWVDATIWSANPRREFGRLDKNDRSLHQKWFPELPIQVTKLTAWKLGENPFHYRSLLLLEMLGNLRLDPEIEHAIVWPSRWGKNGGVLKPNSNQLSAMGLGLAAYTRFAGPQAFGHQTVGHIRYFATQSDDFVTVWVVNHAKQETVSSIEIRNLDSPPSMDQVWTLRSASDSPLATDTVLEQVDNNPVTMDGESGTLTLTVAPISATIIRLRK